ncbi:MAG: hypothetical protein PVI01_17310 [Gemmatimonadales bacterium]|jgi:hypothetical protein
MRRQRPNYKRILGIALGVSLLVHVVVIGFGRLNLGSRGTTDQALSLVSLPTPPEVDRSEVPPESSTPKGGGLALATDVTVSPVEVDPAAFDFMEYQEILSETSSSELSAPVVPRPRITPASVESGLSPIRVSEPALVRLSDRGRRGGGSGIGIHVIVGVGGQGGRGGDNCTPSGVHVRLPDSRNPLIPSHNRTGVPVRFPGRR